MKYILFTLILCCITISVTAKSLVIPFERDTILSNEKVTYKFTQDEKNVHINISTTDEKTIMSILHLGVSVFFDIKGKKKQNVSIKYPAESIRPDRKQQKGGRPKGDRTAPEDAFEEENSRRKKIKEILEKDYSQKAEYTYFDSTEEFHILMNNLDVSVTFTYDEVEGLFEYDLKLPKTKINTDLKKDLSKLTIGVKTVKEKRKENSGINGSLGGFSLGGGGQQSGGKSGGGPPGGGGQGGGPPGGGGGGGQGGGPPKDARQNKTSDTLLNFWFKPNA